MFRSHLVVSKIEQLPCLDQLSHDRLGGEDAFGLFRWDNLEIELIVCRNLAMQA
jgi:hypothetical protein